MTSCFLAAGAQSPSTGTTPTGTAGAYWSSGAGPGLVFITANSLLHLHAPEDPVSCFPSVRRHLAPGGRFVFDVFSPSVRLLAEADGVRRTRGSVVVHGS